MRKLMRMVKRNAYTDDQGGDADDDDDDADDADEYDDDGG